MEVKDLIYSKRVELGITQKQLANMVGVSEGTISRWESGQIGNMKRDKCAELSKALGIPLYTLMGWAEPKPQDPKKKMFEMLINQLTPEEQEDLVKYIEFLISKRDR